MESGDLNMRSLALEHTLLTSLTPCLDKPNPSHEYMKLILFSEPSFQRHLLHIRGCWLDICLQFLTQDILPPARPKASRWQGLVDDHSLSRASTVPGTLASSG